LLSGGWWTAQQFLGAAVRVVSGIGGAGWLIVDDVLIPKPYARLIAFCGWDFDHALRRNVFGLRLVFVVVCLAYVVLQLLKPLSPKPHLSVSQSKKALLPLHLLVTPKGTARLVRLTTAGQFEPVEVSELWEPIRTRVAGLELPEHLGVP
jgi:hypothetical protein